MKSWSIHKLMFLIAKKCGGDALAQTIILEACKLGASRELYEETGIDIRCKLERLKPAALQRSTDAMDMLGCMLKDKCYFHLVVSDEDFFSLSKEGRNDERLTSSNNGSGPSLMLKISEEHSGFIFEPDPHESVKKLKQHSGGSGSIALHMSMRSNSTRGVPNPNAAPESEHGGHNRAIAKVCEKEEVPPPPTRKGLWSCFC
mmetsp:Transcript_21148/g.24025  ORF Transcript_21148/g.24025 Transcript_21148/m.24025 type:complete len:202 (-) Transcript_21148:1205-1810(-)